MLPYSDPAYKDAVGYEDIVGAGVSAKLLALVVYLYRA